MRHSQSQTAAVARQPAGQAPTAVPGCSRPEAGPTSRSRHTGNTGPAGNSYYVTMLTKLSVDLNNANDAARQTTQVAARFVLINHDTGYCRLTVSCPGSIGYNAPQGNGSGFLSGGPNTDFVPTESLSAVVRPGIGDQHYRCAFSDAGHPSPKSLTVTRTHTWALPLGATTSQSSTMRSPTIAPPGQRLSIPVYLATPTSGPTRP